VNEPLVVTVPGDKSISHRALLFASLASGESRLRGVLPGEDPQATAAALRLLGVRVPPLSKAAEEIRIVGGGLRGWSAPAQEIDCANSGTTARLLLGALAAHPFRSTLTGDASLRSRPMRRVTEPLTRMGAGFHELGEADRLPIAIEGGTLQPLDWANPQASAQVKSAILLAGLIGGVSVRVLEPVRSRDHTERMLRGCGATVEQGADPWGRSYVSFMPVDRLEPLDLDVPGDFSSAAFFIALGLLGSRAIRITGTGVNPTRTGLLSVLRRMGANVRVENQHVAGGEPVGDVVVQPGSLRATTVSAHEIPALLDEIPVLAVLAARAEGETRITGAAELRVKESDRLAVLARNLRGLGVAVEELRDGLVVQGTSAPLVGHVQTFDDHRIAMAFGVLAALPDHRIEIDDPDVVAVSFPAFWDHLRAAVLKSA
jgi:3-phosphoshikimate 1-carboxyvinyltransferase